MGVKFLEKSRRKQFGPDGRGLRCVVVAVEQKKKSHLLRATHRLPPYLLVRVPGLKKRQRVLLDVHAVGRRVRHQQMAGPPWPTAGKLRPGYRMSCGRQSPAAYYQPFADGEAELGTVGAVIRTLPDNRYYAITAAHVIIDVGDGKIDLRLTDHAIGAVGPDWVTVAADKFIPASNILAGQYVYDTAALEVPQGFYNDGTAFSFLDPQPSWPNNFQGKFATSDDVDHAVLGQGMDGFVWVQRGGAYASLLPINLIHVTTHFDTEVETWSGGVKPIRYGPLYNYDFTNGWTEGGDSGAPVFIYAKDNPTEVRFLGFHFIANEKEQKWWAVCAENFLARNFGVLNRDFVFAGFDQSVG